MVVGYRASCVGHASCRVGASGDFERLTSGVRGTEYGRRVGVMWRMHAHYRTSASGDAGRCVSGVRGVGARVDIWASGSRFLAVVLNFTTNGVLNLTFIKALNSQLGPICNAYEILQVYPRNAETNVEEVEVIMKVKNELLAQNQDSEILKTWSGDLCLPLPWHGLSCDALNGTSIISKMDLSFSRLTGPLPSSITKLKYLKELNVSNNGFIGIVPQFPAFPIFQIFGQKLNYVQLYHTGFCSADNSPLPAHEGFAN
ncbi:nodulation receptor kinase-like [Salvia miltiorrhiza]|uniref:nodulation receptor kinase-like n=1 Tax=Salvia miltiorrhiza TaxID=226208 RepID=UPI0025ACB613|nr:nodulation receptor kinase-like [Salvia miltiorrhiza]